MESPNWAVGEIVVVTEEDQNTHEDEYLVLHVVGRDGNIPVCEPLATCPTAGLGELIGSLLKAYANAGHHIPSASEEMLRN